MVNINIPFNNEQEKLMTELMKKEFFSNIVEILILSGSKEGLKLVKKYIPEIEYKAIIEKIDETISIYNK